MLLYKIMLSGVVLLSTVALCMAQNDSFSEQVTQPVHEAVKIRRDTQQQEEQWRDQKQALVARYEQMHSEQKQLQARREALQSENRAARERIVQKEKQLADIEQINARIEPFLQNQVVLLQQQLTEGIPFLFQERAQRVQRLSELMTDPDVAVSEKYRKTMEALLVEAEYGNTIEVYQQTIAIEGREMLVNIFRLGRISLFYQSLDRKHCGFFDVAAAAWKPLPAAHNRTIGSAIDIGAKRKPVELLSLPLGRILAQ